jgi:hypothetical protein
MRTIGTHNEASLSWTHQAQQAVDELDDKIRNSDAFKVLKDAGLSKRTGC